jgi:hypothetical protein
MAGGGASPHNMDFDTFVREIYEKQVEWYDKKAITCKRYTYLLNIPIIIFSALTPVVAALDFNSITIIISAIVAIGFGILKFCRFESLWHSYRTTCETLKKEKPRHDLRTDVYESAAEPDKLFVERVLSGISQEHTVWESEVKKKKSEES